MDRFSPVAPATIRVQLLPVGEIERERFGEVLEALGRHVASVKLADIEERGNEPYLLSPKASPRASLLFSYITSPPSEQEQQLSPFELFREPLIVLGIANSSEELGKAGEYLREHYPRVVHRHILLLPEAGGGSVGGQDNITRIAKSGDDGEAALALKDAVSEVAGGFLFDFSTYAKALQASPNIQTPSRTSLSLQRPLSLRSDEGRPASGYATPTQELASPVGGDEASSRPPSRGVQSPPPPSSFEQIQRESIAPSSLARSDSTSTNRGTRTSSQERGAGHTAALSQRKARDRGKARVGIVLGRIHLLAGHWSEALRLLTEHTTTARKMDDKPWVAEGLEGIVVSMLLLAWSKIEFIIPSICYPAAERNHASHVRNLSVNRPSDLQLPEALRQANLNRLSTSLPALLQHILRLYMPEDGVAELPRLVTYEASIRFATLLASLYQYGGELHQQSLDRLIAKTIEMPPGGWPAPPTLTSDFFGLSKRVVDTILGPVYPSPEDNLSATDSIQILTGIYGVYAFMEMKRKQGFVLNDIIQTLTAALNKARKAGAAEAGIHPAASMSTQDFANYAKDFQANNQSLKAMIDVMCDEWNTISQDPKTKTSFPSNNNKLYTLNELVAFYEAATDPEGVLRAITTLLKDATPPGAVDTQPGPAGITLSRDDQTRYGATIHRTIGVSRHFQRSEIKADFWDDYLVRGLWIEPPTIAHALLPASSLGPLGLRPQEEDVQTAGNPLLYDPYAVARTAREKLGRQVLVRNEPRLCRIVLQNAMAIALDIENILLVTEGQADLQLVTKTFQPVNLGADSMKKIAFEVSPTGVGDFKIVGCQIKMVGFRDQIFEIFPDPFTPKHEFLVKYAAEKGYRASDLTIKQKPHTIEATAISSMPFLEYDCTSEPENAIAMYDGELRTVRIAVRNVSGVPAYISKVTDVNGVLYMKYDGPPAPSDETQQDAKLCVDPYETRVLRFYAVGQRGVSQTRVDMFYRPRTATGPENYTRILSMPFSVTTAPALELDNPQVLDVDADCFVLSFDVRNISAVTVAYKIEQKLPEKLRGAWNAIQEKHDGVYGPWEGQVASGKVQRASLRVMRTPGFKAAGVIGADKMAEVREELRRQVVVRWLAMDSNSRVGATHLADMEWTAEMLATISGY